MRLRDITKAAVRHRYDETQDGNTQNPRAISRAYGLLRAIMNTAVDDDLIEASPVHIRGAGYRPKRRRLEPATLEELDTIVEHMPDKWKLMILLASWCALRYGEIAELRRKDIRLRHVNGRWTGVIQVRRGVVFIKRDIRVEPPKSEAGIRDVAIPPHLVPLIQEHLETYAAPGQEGLLFPSSIKRQQWPHSHRVLQEGSRGRWPKGSPLPRPSPHRRCHGCAARRNSRRPAGPFGSLDCQRRPSLPTHRQGTRSTDRREPPEIGQRVENAVPEGARSMRT